MLSLPKKIPSLRIMFHQIDINNFRGIKKTSIKGLGQVNLFWGRNNCGKSSLLDAIFLVAGQSNPLLPVNINRMRDYRGISESDFALNFFNLDEENRIQITAYNQQPRSLMISELHSTSSRVDVLDSSSDLSTTQQGKRYGYLLAFSIDGKGMHSSLILRQKNEVEIEQKIEVDNHYSERLKCRYINSKYDFQTSVEGLSTIMANKAEQYILDALRVVEPTIKDILLSQSDILVDVGLQRRIPINLLGDGIRKMLAIASTIYECRDGIVLVDEISNGFHYSVMENLWKVVFKAAQDNNVQIFASTHDIDSIKGLSKAVRSAERLPESFVSCFKLQKKDDELMSFCYTSDQLEYAIEQEIEMR